MLVFTGPCLIPLETSLRFSANIRNNLRNQSENAALNYHGRETALGTAMTRKELRMKWDQIENKWAAMTRRVRADWPGAAQENASQPLRETAKSDRYPVPGRQAGVQTTETNAPQAE